MWGLKDSLIAARKNLCASPIILSYVFWYFGPMKACTLNVTYNQCSVSNSASFEPKDGSFDAIITIF